MRAYLDASFIIALFANDSFSARAEQFLKSEEPVLLVSDFARAEFASAVAGRLRVGQFGMSEAQLALSNFDAWLPRAAQHVSMTSAISKWPTRICGGSISRCARRMHSTSPWCNGLERTLLTFDEKMAECARVLGMKVEPH